MRVCTSSTPNRTRSSFVVLIVYTFMCLLDVMIYTDTYVGINVSLKLYFHSSIQVDNNFIIIIIYGDLCANYKYLPMIILWYRVFVIIFEIVTQTQREYIIFSRMMIVTVVMSVTRSSFLPDKTNLLYT